MTRRLVLSYLLITAVVLIVLEVPLAVFYGQLERERFTSNAERDAVVLASFYEEVLISGASVDPSFASTYATAVHGRALVVDTTGHTLLDTGDPALGQNLTELPEVQLALQGKRSTGYREIDGSESLYVAVPVSSGDHVVGAVAMALSTDTIRARLRLFMVGLAALAMLVMVTFTAVGWSIARSVTRPLRDLQLSARRFGQGDFEEISVDLGNAPEEVGELARNLNLMAGQLDQLLGQHRAFVADTSHQLRTPLTALRLQLENVAAQLDGDEPAPQVEAALDEVVRLSDLVGDLLKLARVEDAPSIATKDLVAIVEDRASTWRVVAADSGLALKVDVPAKAVLVRAIDCGIEQVLDNLIDNAVGVSSPGSEITVRVAPGRELHTLMVIDQGPGMSDEQKLLAPRRFWRGDASRPGSGLGLAIASSIVRASGGSLHLGDAPDKGLKVSINLPIASYP